MAELQEQEQTEEEIRIRYYKAVDFSAKTVLKLIESMVGDTFKALGFTSPQDYCVKKLHWSQYDAEILFSCEKAIHLSNNNDQIEYRLLMKLWTDLDRGVVKELEGLTVLVQEAIHNPPSRLSKQLLHELIQTKLWPSVQKLADAALAACHALLKKEFLFLLEPKIKISSIFKKMEKLNEDVRLFSLERAVQKFRMMYEMNYQGSKNVFPTPTLDFSGLECLSSEINSSNSCGAQKRTAKPFVAIKVLYIDLVNRTLLCDIISKLNILADRDIDSHFLSSWGRDLNNLQQDLGSRLKVLGKSECLSHKAVYGDPPVDINRWLWTRETKLEKIDSKFWCFVNLATSKEVMLEHLLEGSQKPRVVMVYGPPGSGKTCLCEYFLEKWCCDNSAPRFIRELQLLVFLKERSIRHGSFKHHLKNVMFPRLLTWVPESEVLASLCRFTVCFVMDASAGGTPEFTSAVREVVSHLGHNTAIITKRLEARRDADAHLATDEVFLQPLEGRQRRELCLGYLKSMSNVGVDSIKTSRFGPAVFAHNHHTFNYRNNSERFSSPQEDPNMLVDKFIHKLVSEEREDLCYPLPLAYLLWLWLQDPRHLTKITTISQLFKMVISLCEQMQEGSSENTLRLFHIIKTEKGSGSKPMRKLASLASDVFRSKRCETSCKKDCDLNGFAENEWTNLFPFLEYFSNTMKWRFLHPFLVEVLCAWDMKRGFEERRTLPHSQIEKRGNMYVTIILLLGGFSSGERIKDKDLANHTVKLYRSVGVAGDNDLLAWLSLLREGAWSPALRDLVKRELKFSKTMWSVPHANVREVKGVIRMVERRVFLPREVIIEAEAPEEVVNMLVYHSIIDVRIYPRVCLGLKPRDDLLDALRGAGNVVEFQGKVEEKGASALAHMTRLRTLKLHLTSVAALKTFSVSVKKLLLLDELHLHLHLPFGIPAVRIPRVTVVPRRVIVYVNLYNITDSTCRWAVEVCKKLRCHKNGKTKVYLNESFLSPDKLQYVKTELHPSDVHISQS